VTEEDELPKIMCGECSHKLDLMSDFKEKAHKTERELTSKIDAIKVKAKVISSFLFVYIFVPVSN